MKNIQASPCCGSCEGYLVTGKGWCHHVPIKDKEHSYSVIKDLDKFYCNGVDYQPRIRL